MLVGPLETLRIAIVGHHVAPIAEPFAGGVESFTWYLARWLAGRGHDVTLFGVAGSEVPGVRVCPLDLEPMPSDAARADVSMPAPAFMSAHQAYQRLMLELAGDAYDVIHSHSLHYLPVAMAALLPSPFLLTLHTPPTPWLEASLRCGPVPALSAVSHATRRMWSEVVSVEDVIANGIDVDAWPAGAGGPGAAWCGRIVPEKAPHLAIDAARLAGLPIRLAGPIVDRAYWQAEVRPRLGADAVHLGHLGHADVAALLGSSAVALLTPQWEEPFGLAAVEAMATGTPVAAFARGGLAQLVDEPVGRVAAAGDVRALAAAARDASALARDEVRATARRRHGLDRMGAEYEALYARVCDAAGASLPVRV